VLGSGVFYSQHSLGILFNVEYETIRVIEQSSIGINFIRLSTCVREHLLKTS